MKRLVVYYTLSGNTEEAANKIAGALGAEALRIDTAKPMPKSFAAQILVGGGQVAMNHIPKIKPIDVDIDAYDENILGSPIWNSKGVPAINAFLKDTKAAAKVTSLFVLSQSGDISKCIAAITGKLPNLKNTVSLLDSNQGASKDNDSKIEEFVRNINEAN